MTGNPPMEPPVPATPPAPPPSMPIGPAGRAVRDRSAAALGFDSWEALVLATANAERSGDDERAAHLRTMIQMADIQARNADEEARRDSVPSHAAGKPPTAATGRNRRHVITAADAVDEYADGKEDEHGRSMADRIAAIRARTASSLSDEEVDARIAELDAEAFKIAAAPRRAHHRRRFEAARPDEFAGLTFDDLLPQQNPENKGRLWLASGRKNALIMGPPGHGKTALAWIIGNHAVEAGLWVEVVSVPELLAALEKLPYHALKDEIRSREQELIVDRAKKCDLLVWDDLGAEEGGHGWTAERTRAVLFDILNYRDGRRRLRNLVTANGDDTLHLSEHDQVGPKGTVLGRKSARRKAATDLAVRYGGRIADRLQKDMVGIWVEGTPLRQPAQWNPDGWDPF